LKKKEPKGSNHFLNLEGIQHSFSLVDDVNEAHLYLVLACSMVFLKNFGIILLLALILINAQNINFFLV
jgi:hypothetical protein